MTKKRIQLFLWFQFKKKIPIFIPPDVKRFDNFPENQWNEMEIGLCFSSQQKEGRNLDGFC